MSNILYPLDFRRLGRLQGQQEQLQRGLGLSLQLGAGGRDYYGEREAALGRQREQLANQQRMMVQLDAARAERARQEKRELEKEERAHTFTAGESRLGRAATDERARLAREAADERARLLREKPPSPPRPPSASQQEVAEQARRRALEEFPAYEKPDEMGVDEGARIFASTPRSERFKRGEEYRAAQRTAAEARRTSEARRREDIAYRDRMETLRKEAVERLIRENAPKGPLSDEDKARRRAERTVDKLFSAAAESWDSAPIDPALREGMIAKEFQKEIQRIQAVRAGALPEPEAEDEERADEQEAVEQVRMEAEAAAELERLEAEQRESAPFANGGLGGAGGPGPLGARGGGGASSRVEQLLPPPATSAPRRAFRGHPRSDAQIPDIAEGIARLESARGRFEEQERRNLFGPGGQIAEHIAMLRANRRPPRPSPFGPSSVPAPREPEPAYAESEGRRVEEAPTSFAIRRLLAKTPEERREALREMLEQPEKFRAKGVDVDAVLLAVQRRPRNIP